MRGYPIETLTPAEFPPLLREIPDPPTSLTYRGALPDPSDALIAVVGSRKYSTYGKHAVEHLIGGLAGAPVGIISGLALGLDSLAHEAALRAGLYTLAVPGGGLNDDVIYPRRHLGLAHKILSAGGGLLSEYEPSFQAAPWSFPKRNRVVVGMCHATLLIEAGGRSGTLISARLASEYDREVLVVPGSIFSANSVGTHQFLKLGATPVTSPDDVLEALRIEHTPAAHTDDINESLSDTERTILTHLTEPLDRDAIIRATGYSSTDCAHALTLLELNGYITETGGIITRLK